ncbi:tyrosine-protein kinase family protein [Mucilaginibacter sp. UR6-11]|uniref:GumC family protein n=1 Tax=Mucilaginibacter sp. UR6-11 TaxID=1435644 RepID=UPI001E5E7748|nr:tyrosine-protein kinase family protein [Mucilaginibacter sp. UR6-11]MCC8424850.1 polysaccharide biosynthesis tyrosine autokinase [Mucilaginibacter sp. UR6-11]
MNTNNDLNVIEDDEQQVNLKEILFRYLSHWKWIVLSLIVFLFLGYIKVKSTTPLYSIETNILIKQDKGRSGGGDDLLKSLDLFSSNKVIDNEVQILKSYTLMEKVVSALDLTTSYYQNGHTRKIPLYKDLPFKVKILKPKGNGTGYLKVTLLNSLEADVNGKKILLNQPVQSDVGLILITTTANSRYYTNVEIDVAFNSTLGFYQGFSGNLTIVPASKEGTVLLISYQDAIPKRGEDILNRLVYEYNRAAIEDKNKVISSTLTFIEDRLTKLAEELGSAEEKVESYKSSNHITDIGAQSQAFLTTMQENDASLSKVNIQLGVLKNLQAYIHNEKGGQSKLPSMLGVEDATILGLVAQLADIQLKKQSLLQTIPETNPIVHSLNDQISSLKDNIDQSIQNLQSGLLVTKQQLALKNAKFESVIKSVPTKERGLLDVMRQQDIKNTLFTFLLQKREEQEMSLASNLADSRTIDPARSSLSPIKPVPQQIMMIFFIIGLLLPIGIIYILGLLNNKITNRSDLEKLTRVPVLAEIGHTDDSNPLIVVEKPRSMIAEQIRALRTNLQFISADVDHKVLLFTSNTSGEGKSFVSLNLGASLAMSGKKVVILELDLRKPKLHVALQMDNIKGLSNYLISNYSYKEVIEQIPQQPNYYMITSGPIPPNPAELLTNGRIETLIKELQQDFDYVVIDAPPVGLVTDAQILGRYANATIFIVRHNYTFKNQILFINDLYKNQKFPNLNIVFNSVDYSAGYGYGYGYSYGYGYGGGYYQEDDDKRKKNIFVKWFGKKR